MKIKQLIDAFQHKIVDTGAYGWDAFGPNARFLDFSGTDQMQYAADDAHVVYDTATLEVYLTEVSQFGGKTYRWINPSYLSVYKNEHTNRSINFMDAHSSGKFIDLDEPEDFIEKATAIFNGEEFDERVMVKLHDFPDELFMQLARLAHEEDLTINQMAEKILQSYIDSNQ